MSLPPAPFDELLAPVNRAIGSSPMWKRFRIAVTAQELEAYRQYIKSEEAKNFVHALRGIPLQIEEHPEHPMYIMEPL